MKLLIADKSPLWRIGIRKALEDIEGMLIVGEASNGKEILMNAGATCPDVILMDVDRPICDGIEMIRQIGSTYPDTRILILTNELSLLSIRNALEAGAKGYMLKNTSLDELITSVKAVHEGNSYFHPSVARLILKDMFPAANNNGKHSQCREVLSERELEILRYIAEGMGNQAIADKLFISIKTVQTHRRNMMEKLNIHDRVGLVKFALKKGLITLNESELEP